MCTLVGSRSAARVYASRASLVWLLHDSYWQPVSPLSSLTQIVKTTYQSSQVVPNLRNVRVESDGPGVRIKRISVLVDLVVKHADGAPECRIAAVAVDCLLVCFVRFGVLLLRHVAPAEQIPALRVSLVCDGYVSLSCQVTNWSFEHTGCDRFLKVLNGLFLAAKARALLVVQPTKLLQHLCVTRVTLQDTRIGSFG